MPEIKKFTVRMPEELYNRLSEYADKSYLPMSRLILIAVDEFLKKDLTQTPQQEESLT